MPFAPELPCLRLPPSSGPPRPASRLGGSGRGATLSRGDTLPGPGFTAILTAISEDACAGDSGRGAVAEALVEALACDAAAGRDFSIAAAAGRAAPSREEWASMFVDAS
eukprot:scaffold59132_cov56-Phaeocystis_antarctica.AAC.4